MLMLHLSLNLESCRLSGILPVVPENARRSLVSSSIPFRGLVVFPTGWLWLFSSGWTQRLLPVTEKRPSARDWRVRFRLPVRQRKSGFPEIARAAWWGNGASVTGLQGSTSAMGPTGTRSIISDWGRRMRIRKTKRVETKRVETKRVAPRIGAWKDWRSCHPKDLSMV